MSSQILKRFRRNAAILFGGQGLASVLGFATLAINARALGPELLGVLALLQAFIVVVSRLFSFDTWQPLIKFGAEAQASGDSERLRDIIALGFLYDFAGAISATIVGFFVVYFSLPWFGIAKEYGVYAAVFALALPFGATSSATGLLRLFGHFGLLTSIGILASCFSTFGALLLWFFKAPFEAYVFVYAGLGAAQSLAIVGVAWRVWLSRGMPSLLSPSLANRDLRQGFFTFSWTTWGLSSLNTLRQNADSFVVAALLGPAASGIYKLAMQLASLINRFGTPLQQVIFPEIAELVAKNEHPALRRVLAIAFCGGLAILAPLTIAADLFAEPIVRLVGGREFVSAAMPFLWLSIANGISVAGFFLRPTVVTLIGPGFLLTSYIVATIMFVPVLYASISWAGVAGAGIAQIVFTVIWYAFNAFGIVKHLKMKPSDLNTALRAIASFVLHRIKPWLPIFFGERRFARKIRILSEIKQKNTHVWAGYYDLAVCSPNERRVVYHAWQPGALEAEFGTYNLKNGAFEKLGSTRAWSFQLGTRLQFISDDVVVHYEEQNGLISTCFRRISDGQILRRLEGLAYYGISQSKSWISTVNYAHIRQHRPGYGFDFPPLQTDLALAIYNLKPSQAAPVLLLTLDDCIEYMRNAIPEQILRTEEIHLNHPSFSPNEDLVAFVIAGFSNNRVQKLFVQDWSTKELFVCPLTTASHFCWTQDGEISIYGCNSEGRWGYWYWSLFTNTLRPMGTEWPSRDGHQSMNPQHPDLWTTDTYPNRYGYQSLFSISNGEKRRLGDFHAPLGMAFDKCDLHPRWSTKNQFLIIDTACNGRRQTLILEMNP